MVVILFRQFAFMVCHKTDSLHCQELLLDTLCHLHDLLSQLRVKGSKSKTVGDSSLYIEHFVENITVAIVAYLLFG